MSNVEWYPVLHTDGYLGLIHLPKYGTYYLWQVDGLYGISKRNIKPHCGYASLAALFKAKGL